MSTFKFRKHGCMDLTARPQIGHSTIQCANDNFTLRNFRVEDVDGIIPTCSAIVCLNDKPICKYRQDDSNTVELKPLEISSKAILASISIKLRNFSWKCYDVQLPLTLEVIASSLADTELQKLKQC